ncbi:hypothetical protein SS1G_05128 [Sclerotinia sclerotiorum 1980 UF-70]|uniref:Uncharacterized protein n=2 Tax=Sclerotinia sclerotiorum (strain ATCC 18683 / 1980 / Ss-1) TaxID=665079 RepID=A7EII5_SCLS1|nr:hypothetical protein SS1G_05128 [Sclerotinia sclerotiorum 1980 UF-70]APA11669.1 hypothetical protein sscle_08g064390 [Sclerotinia sclerotiorum 1980 UF-70]EDO02651.1 hypothetical protein SS1G_05128 [Sclerotinia sclerotiorum 1980 UF-70]
MPVQSIDCSYRYINEKRLKALMRRLFPWHERRFQRVVRWILIDVPRDLTEEEIESCQY